MAKDDNKKDIKERYARDKAKIDKEVKKAGLTYSTIAGAVIAIIGLLLILFNLSAAILAFVGIVLIWFGLKMLGVDIKL